jgi:hypothetical protein
LKKARPFSSLVILMRVKTAPPKSCHRKTLNFAANSWRIHTVSVKNTPLAYDIGKPLNAGTEPDPWSPGDWV